MLRVADGWRGFAEGSLYDFEARCVLRFLGPFGKVVPGELVQREVKDADGSVRWKRFLVLMVREGRIGIWLGPEGRDPAVQP